MNIKIVFSILFLLGNLIAQVETNFSYEVKYGDGKQVKTKGSSAPTQYNYFENLLDISTYFGSNTYVFTQMEYSNKPVYGVQRTSVDSMINSFYVEYNRESYLIKLGDLYELIGRGLSFYTLQDQNIDYNNSVKGAYFNYWGRDNFEISGLYGLGDYYYRSNPSFRETDREISSNIFVGSFRYENDMLGYLNYSFKFQNIHHNPKQNNFYGGTEIGDDIIDRANDITSQVFDIYYGNIDIHDTVVVINNNLNWNTFVGPLDIYLDKSWINYDKIYGERVSGSRFYTSIYTEILETGITYEYKNYNTPYLLKSVSNPPIVYREGNSILASRNAHSINFGNEIGHQLEVNKNLLGSLNLLGNLSMSFRHQNDMMADMSIIDFLRMEENDQIYEYFPFRQFYLELNGWTLSDRLYYKLGIDQFTEFNVGSKNIFATTIPTQWVWKLRSGSSITTYLEFQDKTVKGPIPGNYSNFYISSSFSYQGKWIITGFYDQEISEDKTSQWPGLDFSYNLTSESQLSLFYGSQKGGLVCANGICAEQPGFEDGVKITFRSLF